MTTQTQNLSAQVGRDQFLQLLVAQMRNQNPLDPLKDQEFVAQLAQFSSLEGIEKLNASFEEMLRLQQLTQGASLVGKTVVYDRPDSTGPQRGTVESARVQDGKVQLVVGGSPVPLDRVRGVEQ